MHFNVKAIISDAQRVRKSFCFHVNSSFVLIMSACITEVGIIGLMSEVISEENELLDWNKAFVISL